MRILRAAACASLAAGAALGASQMAIGAQNTYELPAEAPLLIVVASALGTWLVASLLLQRPRR